jgi:hypothetical protein
MDVKGPGDERARSPFYTVAEAEVPSEGLDAC